MAAASRTNTPTRLVRRAAVCVALAASAQAAPRPVHPVEITVGGHTYRVPSDIFEGGVVEGGKQDGFLIELAWPEMRGLLPQEMTWPPRPTIRVLAVTGAQPGQSVPSEQLEQSLRHGLDVATGLWVGEHRPLERSDEPPGGPAPDDAIKVASKPLFRDTEANDVFVPEPLSTPSQYVSCISVGKEYVHASCAQELVFQGLLLKVSYDRDFVKDWKQIAARLTDYLSQHEVSHGAR